MNGPEHYRESERLLGVVMDSPLVRHSDPVNLAAAQVHATLALAAATVDARRGGMDTWEQYPGPEVTP